MGQGKQEVVRNHTRIIYSSSYDRGLFNLLKRWDRIKKEVPNAELHVCYGWNLFVKFYSSNPERMAWKKQMDDLMKQEGIFHHGRIGQDKLSELTKMCGIWAYPTDFQEISCITAMQAQALGAVPVVTNYGALKETVQYGEKVDGDVFEQETMEKWCDSLIWWLKNPKEQESIREEMIEWAKNTFSWEEVAKKWNV